MTGDDLVHPIPDGVPDIGTWEIACHEIGHGYMAAHLGHEVAEARMQCSWWSGDAQGGYARWLAPDEDEEDTWADAIVMVALAGREAGAVAISYHTGWSLEHCRDLLVETSSVDLHTAADHLRHATRRRRDLEREVIRTIHRAYDRGDITRLALRLADKRRIAGRHIERAA